MTITRWFLGKPAFLVFLAVLAVGCSFDDPADPGPDPGRDEAIVIRIDSSAIIAKGFGSGIDDRRRLTLLTDSSWSEFWGEIWADVPSEFIPPVPAVAFDSSMLVAVTFGAQASSGYSIRVDSLIWDADTLDIFVTERSPLTRGCNLAFITEPYMVVLAPRVSGLIRFHDRSEGWSCG
jgi:hypothetical protein